MLNFDVATKEELLAYAKEELGLNLSRSLRRDIILAKIHEKMRGPAKSTEDRVVIRIHKDHNLDPDFNDDVTITVNGRTIIIKRDFDVAVPPQFVHVLKNAKTCSLTMDPETGEKLWQEAPAYPFTIVSGADVLERFERGEQS